MAIMALKLDSATHADAGRIAEIHMAAFGTNAMLHAQFPTPSVREGLRESVRIKALADIDDPRITVLVVRGEGIPEEAARRHSSSHDDGGGGGHALSGAPGGEGDSAGTVIAFAKWSHPVGADEDYEETPWVWPSETDMHVLESWVGTAAAVEKRALRDEPCYCLTFMGTDPPYERKGAASMMVRWGLEQCRKQSIPAYLESTLEAAPFYERMGFVAFATISLRYQRSGREVDELYEEIAFTYRPGS